MATKKQDVLALLDKAVGKKGPLRIPAYWMREVLLKIMDWAEGLTPKINLPTKVSQLENDVPYLESPFITNQSNWYPPDLNLNGVTIISNRTDDFTFTLENVEDKFSYYILQLNYFSGSISFSNAMIHWEKPLPQQFDKYTKYLITLKSVNGYNFFGTYIESPLSYEFKIRFTSNADEHRPLYYSGALVNYMSIDGEEIEPTPDYQFTAGSHEVIIRTNNTENLFVNTAYAVGATSGAIIWSIDSLELPIGLDRIDSQFLGFSSFRLTNELIIPDSVDHLSNYCLQVRDCPSIYIPDVNSISSSAFYGCFSYNFSGPLASDDGIFIVKNGRVLCMSASNNTRYITFPDNAIDIKGSDINFDYVATIDFNNISHIFTATTSGSNYSLESVTFGKNISSIGEDVFDNKYSLQTVYCKAVNPPALGKDAFYTNITRIYVPSESVNAYKNATNWSAYANKIYGYNF